MGVDFLRYITLFQSRLAATHLVLSVTDLSHQPKERLLRRISARVADRSEVGVASTDGESLSDYLVEKKFITKTPRKSGGRYPGLVRGHLGLVDESGAPLDVIDAYLVDVWMSDPRVRSTVGTPTVENAGEYLQLAMNLGLVSAAKNTWTSAGQLVVTARNSGSAGNPFIPGSDGPVLLRQIIAVDGLILKPLLNLVSGRTDGFRRGEIALEFGTVVGEAVSALGAQTTDRGALREAREFEAMIRKTAEARESMSAAPGVLEHRVTPRLEWLAELGYLDKDGSRNSFQYVPNSSTRRLSERLRTTGDDPVNAELVASLEWRSNPIWTDAIEGFSRVPRAEAVLDAYSRLRRRIGPSSIRDVAFLACLVSEEPLDYSDAIELLTQVATETPGASLSRGRYGREAVNVFIPMNELR
ncbi:MAG: hypothetical protein QM747_04120 [Nocardioides sp.]